MASCYKCNKTITEGIDRAMPVDAVCEHCSSWLHACANCAFYDEYSQSKCRESKAEFVFDRLGKNACSFFKLKQGAVDLQQNGHNRKKASPRMEQNDREGKARENLARLFRK
jgi:hypothetical protein